MRTDPSWNLLSTRKRAGQSHAWSTLIHQLLPAAVEAEDVAAESQMIGRPQRVRVEPAAIEVVHESWQQLKVLASDQDGVPRDVTWLARFRALDPSVAAVRPGGVVVPISTGEALIEVEAGGWTITVPVRVRLAVMTATNSDEPQLATYFAAVA